MASDDFELLAGLDDEEEEKNIEDTYLVFRLAAEEYGISVIAVTEIVRLPKIIEVPDAARHIRGVINLRDKVIPVMDVRIRFGLEPTKYSDRTVIIVAEYNDQPIGFIVDSVKEVTEIEPSQIVPPTQWYGAENDRARVVRGMAKRDNSVSIVLDLDKMLAVDAHNLPMRSTVASEASVGAM